MCGNCYVVAEICVEHYITILHALLPRHIQMIWLLTYCTHCLFLKGYHTSCLLCAQIIQGGSTCCLTKLKEADLFPTSSLLCISSLSFWPSLYIMYIYQYMVRATYYVSNLQYISDQQLKHIQRCPEMGRFSGETKILIFTYICVHITIILIHSYITYIYIHINATTQHRKPARNE